MRRTGIVLRFGLHNSKLPRDRQSPNKARHKNPGEAAAPPGYSDFPFAVEPACGSGSEAEMIDRREMELRAQSAAIGMTHKRRNGRVKAAAAD